MKVGFVLLVLLPYISAYPSSKEEVAKPHVNFDYRDVKERYCKEKLRKFEICLEPFFDIHKSSTRDHWTDHNTREIFLQKLNNAQCPNIMSCSKQFFGTEVESKLENMLLDIYEEADRCIFEGIVSRDDVTSCISNKDEDTNEDSNSKESTTTVVPSTTTQSSTVTESTESTTEVSSTTVETTSTTETVESTTETIADSTTVIDESSTTSLLDEETTTGDELSSTMDWIDIFLKSESSTDSPSTTEEDYTDWMKSSEETTTAASSEYLDKRIKISDEDSEPLDKEKRDEILKKEVEILEKEVEVLNQEVEDHSDESADSSEKTIFIPRNSSSGKRIYWTTTMVFAIFFLFLLYKF